MKIKLENPEKNVALLEIELDKESFEEAMNKAFNKNKGRFNVPGFRKGKAPRAIVQRFYGEGVLYEDAVEIICPDAYQKAIEEQTLTPVSRPEIDVKQIGSGQNFIFTAQVAIKPEVAIENYYGVEVEKAVYEVTQEDIDKEIDRERQANARVITIEDRPVVNDDIAVIDFEGFLNDKAFEGGKGEKHELVIGSGQFMPGFEEQLIGKNAGDETEVKVIFPADYNAADLAGKEAVFKVKIHEIKKKELPELDDEFAKDVSEFETLTEYIESIKKKLDDINENKQKTENESRVLRKVVELADMEIPQAMIETRIDSRIEEYSNRLQNQGMKFEEYIARMGMDIDTLRAQISSDVKNEIETHLVIEEIGKKENIEATNEEVELEITKYAEQYKIDKEEMKKRLNEDYMQDIKTGIITRKTVESLSEKATYVKEKKGNKAKEE